MKKRLFVFIVLFGAALFFLKGADKALAEEIVPLPELTRPSKIQVDGDEIFVVNNRYNIIIYSLKDFKLKNQFGKKGEGPGEFKYSFKLSIRPDFIFVDSQDRISWFSREGKFLKQKNKPIKSSYIPFRNKFIVKSTQFLSYQVHKTELGICDSGLKKIKKLHEFILKIPLIGGPAPPIKEWKLIHPYHHICYDITSGKIFVFDTQKGFYINVFDENGHNLYTINKDKEIEKIKVPEEYKERRRKEFKQDQFWRELQKPKLIFPEYFPSFHWAAVNQGKIYIHTYKTRNNKTQFIILDFKGKILKEIYLPFPDHSQQTVYHNKLYKLVEDEETETWELHVYKM
ncbi:MAG: 6-bladed beta-propeller [Candidatus Aminicenantes bacterium]|jgi:hypothetical protein